MVRKIIKLNLVDDVKAFVNIANQQDFNIDLRSGNYIVDAKSIMGVFSLDLSKNIECLIHNEETNCGKLLHDIEPFCVN